MLVKKSNLMGLGLGSPEVPSGSSLCFCTPEQRAQPVQISSQRGLGSELLPDQLAMVFPQVWSQACDHKEGAEEQQLLFHLSGQSRSDRG